MSPYHLCALLQAALATTALVTPAVAFAQEAPAATSADELVVTAQRENRIQVVRGGQVGVLGDKPAADTPFSIRSYGESLILNQQPQTLGQVLENDPTVRTTYGFGNAAEQFVIRGFTLYGDDVGLDGLYGLTPRQLVAPELYSQVQVLNGASAFLNGAAPGGSGIGGSVNLITKRAGDRPLTRITADYSSDANFGGSFDVSRRFGANDAVGLRVNGALRSGDVAIDDEFRQAYVLGAALDWRGERARVSLDLDYQRFEVDHLRPKVTLGAGLTSVPDAPDADHNYGQAFNYTKLRDVFGILHAEYDLADNVLLYASAGARDGSEKGIYDSVTVTDAATGAASGADLYVPRTDNNEALVAGLRGKWSTGGFSNEANLGGAYTWQVNRNAYDFRYGPGFAGYATNIYDTPQVSLPSSSLVGGDLDNPFPVSRTRLGSLFASDTIGGLGDRVLLTAGLRLQQIRVTSYSYGDGSQSGEYDKHAVTPVVGLVVKPTSTLSLYANRIEGLQQGPTAPIDVNVLNSGEVFAPAKSRQYEAGAKLALNRFNLSAAVFQIEEPNGYSISTPTATNANALTFGVYGQQRNRGLEITADGEPTPGLRVIAGASFSDATLRDTAGGVNDGNTAVGVPDYLANASVEWDLPFLKGATVTGRVVRTGKQEVNAANTLEILAWTRFDLGARYVTVIDARPVTFRFTVDNVANKSYWASAFDVFGTALLQGTPRTYKLSMSLDL